MKRIFFILSIAGATGTLTPASASGGGDEAVVIYNSRLTESKALAEYYAKKREVPKSQVFGFALTTGEEISRKEFHDALQKPLAKKLEAAKLWRHGPGEVQGTNGKPVGVASKVLESKIRYAVLCYGVPLRILHDANHKEAGEESLRPEFRRNGAAVDSELACLPILEQGPPLNGPLHNPVYTTTNVALLHPTNGVLLVTRLDGPTPEIARGLLDKALQAEHDGLWGRAYFDLRNTTEPGMKPGDDWIRGAAEVARHFGFETVVDEGGGVFPASFPMSHIAYYAGWYRENVAGPFELPKVEFMPGAFAYHLHSFSAASLRVTDHNWVGPLLAKGATCTMGCVDEPYLGGTPDVGVFTGRLLFFGFTFGEAAYAGQPVLSWQTTVVGDPLYRPFGKDPQLLHGELARRDNKLIEWSHLRVVNLNLARNSPVAELAGYLEQIDTTKQSAVLKEKLADLYAAQGKPSSAVLTYQQALKLAPSPQQRIRLRLTLGEKLTALNRDEDAYVNYLKFLEESPDYADTPSIYRKLLPLAQKLGKKDDAARYEEKINPPTPPSSTNNPPAPAKSQ
ncbi:MAG: TIGR03790 family protein [Verrucomicrobia bacterium]|nr:TIGR03790 family protein [Verrucomicrobiota bacterium]